VHVLEPATRKRIDELHNQVRTLRATPAALGEEGPVGSPANDFSISLSSSAASGSLSPFTSPQTPTEDTAAELEGLRAENRKLESGEY